MARKIRDDLEGVVYAHGKGNDVVRLAAGQKVPDGVTVGDHLTTKAAAGDDSTGDAETKPLDKMTVDELRAHAAEAEIDLGEATKKADILAAITAAAPADPDADPAS